MKIDLNEIEALARAATPGPWEATRQTDDECSFMGYFIEAGDKTISDDGTAPGHADALFIAAANPAAVLELIALARQADTPAIPAQSGIDTTAIPLVSGAELLARTQPLPKWIDDMKGSDPTMDSVIEYIEQLRAAQPVQQPAPVAGQEPVLWAVFNANGQAVYTHATQESVVRNARFIDQPNRVVGLVEATPVPAASVQPESAKVDQLIELAGALELEKVRHVIAQLRAMRFREGPFQAGYETAIDELEVRLGFAETKQAELIDQQSDSGRDAALVDVRALAWKWHREAVKQGFACSEPAQELFEVLGWPAHPTNVAQAGELSDAGTAALVLEQAAQACDQQADGTNGPYRTACLQCANAVRELRDAAAKKGGA